MSFRIPYNGAGIAFLRTDPNDMNNFLIFMGQRSLPPFRKTWSIPGGSVEKKLGEDSFAAASREFREETSIDPSIFTSRPIGKWEKRFPLFQWVTYFYITDAFFKDSVPHEFYKLEWVSYKNLKHYRCRPFTRSEMGKAMELFVKFGNDNSKHTQD